MGSWTNLTDAHFDGAHEADGPAWGGALISRRLRAEREEKLRKNQRGIREFARSDMPLQQVETAKALATAAAKALDLTKKPAEVR